MSWTSVSRNFRFSIASYAAASILLAVVGDARAAMIVLDAVDRGFYQNLGQQNPASLPLNYAAGDPLNVDWGETRSFFVFDLSVVSDAIVSAELRLFNPSGGFVSVDLSETYTIFDVSTTTTQLKNGASGTNIFDDLGSGTDFGATEVTTADNNAFVTVALNGAAVTALNSVMGEFAFGGAITTLNGTATDREQIFATSNGEILSDTQLVLTTQSPAVVPEPSSFALFCISGVGFAWAHRRRSKGGML